MEAKYKVQITNQTPVEISFSTSFEDWGAILTSLKDNANPSVKKMCDWIAVARKHFTTISSMEVKSA